jgi:soluble lytic murein transglycosylase
LRRGLTVLALAALGGLLPVSAARAPLPAPVAAPAAQPPNPIEGLFQAVSRCQSALPESDRWQIAGVIHHESQRYGYDPYFVVAMIEVESRCSPKARGIRGGVGLTQVKLSTAKEVAEEAGIELDGPVDLVEPAVNVRLGLRYLWTLERQFRDPYLAMAAYNMGPARVARMPRWRARQAGYVRKILHRYENLLARA